MRLGRPHSQVVRIAIYHAIVSSPLTVPDWCFVDETSFRDQLQRLATDYDVIPLSTVVPRLREQSIRRPTVAITLDDGFQNSADIALPILREVGTPATIFLTTGLIDTADTVWFCRLLLALTNTTVPALEWNDIRFDLSTHQAKASASREIQRRLKTLPHDRLLTELRAIVLDLRCDPNEAIPPGSPFRILRREEIRAMLASDLVEVGAHTQSHAILSLLPPGRQREEIQQSARVVEEITGHRCTLFAYPNGRREDYDSATLQILRESGLRTCVTAIEGPNDVETDTLELRRYGIGASSYDFPHFLEGFSD